MLNEVFKKLEDEEERRQENRRHIKLIADKQHLVSKVAACNVKIQTILTEMEAITAQELGGAVTAGGGGTGGHRGRRAAVATGDAVGMEDDEDDDAPVATSSIPRAVRQRIFDSDDDDDGAPVAPGAHFHNLPTSERFLCLLLATAVDTWVFLLHFRILALVQCFRWCNGMVQYGCCHPNTVLSSSSSPPKYGVGKTT